MRRCISIYIYIYVYIYTCICIWWLPITYAMADANTEGVVDENVSLCNPPLRDMVAQKTP